MISLHGNTATMPAMGMHYGFIAASTTVDQLRAAFTATWPDLQVARTATLPSLEGYLDWQRTHERPVTAEDWAPDNRGVEVYGLLQDGRWAVLLDSSLVLASDREALAQLSTRLGTCVAFVVQSTSGSASFLAFRGGQLLRSVENFDGELVTHGARLPEEAALPKDRYYLAEAEALQQRMGLSFLDDPAPREVTALATVDQADYAGLSTTQPGAEAAPARKPWWKVW